MVCSAVHQRVQFNQYASFKWHLIRLSYVNPSLLPNWHILDPVRLIDPVPLVLLASARMEFRYQSAYPKCAGNQQPAATYAKFLITSFQWSEITHQSVTAIERHRGRA